MSKRKAVEVAADFDTESDAERSSRGASKRLRRATGSTPSLTSQKGLRANGSVEQSDDDASEESAAQDPDLEELEDRIRTDIDAAQSANAGRLGVRPLLCFYSITGSDIHDLCRQLPRRGSSSAWRCLN